MRQLLFFLVVLVASFSMTAQTYFDDDTKAQEERAVFERQGKTLGQLNVLFSGKPSGTPPVGSSVFIDQIGSFNTANVTTTSTSAFVDINQEGNSNFLEVNYNVSSVIAQINQIGNNNRFIDYVSQSNQNIDIEYTQQGSNLTFEKYGTNTLTASMSFRQTGFDKTIIVRSFN